MPIVGVSSLSSRLRFGGRALLQRYRIIDAALYRFLQVAPIIGSIFEARPAHRFWAGIEILITAGLSTLAFSMGALIVSHSAHSASDYSTALMQLAGNDNELLIVTVAVLAPFLYTWFDDVKQRIVDYRLATSRLAAAAIVLVSLILYFVSRYGGTLDSTFILPLSVRLFAVACLILYSFYVEERFKANPTEMLQGDQVTLNDQADRFFNR